MKSPVAALMVFVATGVCLAGPQDTHALSARDYGAAALDTASDGHAAGLITLVLQQVP